jgi:GntR family transcriptional regulator
VCTRIDPNRHGCATGDLAVLVLDNDSPVPLHEQLSVLLREQIARRRLTGRVPSILSLAQEHGVSHRTAARALTTLRDEGLIVSVRGKGYYVC